MLLLPIILLIFSLILFAHARLVKRRLLNTRYRWCEIPNEELPPRVQELIPEADHNFRKLGFRVCGNYRAIWRLFNAGSRYYLHDTGLINADVGGEAISFHTLFADGSVLETSSTAELHNELNNLPETSRLQLLAAGSRDIATLYRRHDEQVREHAARRGTAPVPLRTQQIGQFTHYMFTLCDWQFFLNGTLPFQPAPHSFDLPVETVDESGKLVFPTAKEHDATSTPQDQRQHTLGFAKTSFLPSTGRDLQALVHCVLFYTTFTVGSTGLAMYLKLQMSNLPADQKDAFFWPMMGVYTVLGLFVSLMFYGSYKRMTAQPRLH